MEHSVRIFSDIIFPVINFIGFVGVLFYFLKDPARNFFLSRSESLQRNISESTESFQKAKLQLDEAQRKLAQIENEKADLLENTKRDIEAQKKRSSAELNALMETLKAEHAQKIDEEFKKAQRRLKSTAIQKMVETTEALFKKNLSSEDHQGLAEEFLETAFLEKANIKDSMNESKERGALRSSTC